MKILHIIPNLGVGGTEKMLFEICRGLDRERFQQVVVSIKSGGPTKDKLNGIPVPVIVLETSDGFWKGLLDLPRVHGDLVKVIKEIRPDIVHTWLTRANVAGRLAARAAGVRKVISSLRVMEAEKTYHLWAERLTRRWASVMTVNCTSMVRFAAERIGMPESRIVTIFNGIDAGSPDVPAPKDRSRNGDRWLVGTMGRLHRQKGVDLFIESAKIVLEKYPECRFLIAGEGPEKKNLEALSGRLGIGSQVTFRGVEESRQFLAGTDLFVLASRWEGMPNVVMEAMSLGIPVIASTVGGVPDLIDDGKDGLLFEPGDVQGCSKAILKMIQDAQLRGGISRSARAKVVSRFSLKKMISEYARLYESLS